MKRIFLLKGLDCPNCSAKIEKEVGELDGVQSSVVNLMKQTLTINVTQTAADTIASQIETIVHSHEPDVEVSENVQESYIPEKKQEANESYNNEDKKLTVRLATGAAIYAIGMALTVFAKVPLPIELAFLIVSYVILGGDVVWQAVRNISKGRVFDEHFLMSVSTIGAFVIGEYPEAVAVMLFYQVGEFFQSLAVKRSRKSISDLMDIKPEYANLKTKDGIEVLDPSDVKVGDIVIAKKGEKIPLDGIVVKGAGSLDTASLTGETKTQDVKKDDQVLSGSIVLDGLLEIKVTEKYENSTVSKILELVENATDKKAKTETFVNKAAKIYTPIVLGIAALVAIFLPLISNVEYLTENGSIYRALIFLVISCPCAIAISVPLCYFSGIGKSSKEGILIKGSDYLDGIKDIKEIVFDKTGTLTKGQFTIDKVEVYGQLTKEQVLEYAVLGESYSNHPIAKSIIKKSKMEKYIAEHKEKVSSYEELAGKGIKYNFEGKVVLVGNSSLVEKEKEKSGSTKIYVKVDSEIVGAICLKDEIKHGTKAAIAKLNARGIITKMFTGDNTEIAEKIAKELGIKEMKSEMLPNEKYQELEKEIAKYENNGKVAFVGDGINDSPVLARADIGISMGGVGAGSSIEASDVVIMTDAIEKINDAIDISKKTSRVIKQNLIFSIGVKVLVLVLSIFGVANMWEAVFADVGATLITVLNSIKILK